MHSIGFWKAYWFFSSTLFSESSLHFTTCMKFLSIQQYTLENILTIHQTPTSHSMSAYYKRWGYCHYLLLFTSDASTHTSCRVAFSPISMLKTVQFSYLPKSVGDMKQSKAKQVNSLRFAELPWKWIEVRTVENDTKSASAIKIECFSKYLTMTTL